LREQAAVLLPESSLVNIKQQRADGCLKPSNGAGDGSVECAAQLLFIIF